MHLLVSALKLFLQGNLTRQEVAHGKYKRLKLGGGQAYDRFNTGWKGNA
jgi:hypothetical protein